VASAFTARIFIGQRPFKEALVDCIGCYCLEYSTTFAAGALLYDETRRVLTEVDNDGPLDEVGPDVLNINSQSGCERRVREVERRMEHVGHEVWNDFLGRSATEQAVLLYYACMKAFPLRRAGTRQWRLPSCRRSAEERCPPRGSNRAYSVTRCYLATASESRQAAAWSGRPHSS